MVTGTRKTSSQESAEQFSGTVKESAHQIWLAGLGAFAKAQEEGGKVFETLVKEGTAIQRKTQETAQEKIAQASGKMASLASDMGSRASGQWDKLENIFEERVAKALGKLGVPSTHDIEALTARIDELSRKVDALSKPPGAASAKKPAVRKSAPASKRKPA